MINASVATCCDPFYHQRALLLPRCAAFCVSLRSLFAIIAHAHNAQACVSAFVFVLMLLLFLLLLTLLAGFIVCHALYAINKRFSHLLLHLRYWLIFHGLYTPLHMHAKTFGCCCCCYIVHARLRCHCLRFMRSFCCNCCGCGKAHKKRSSATMIAYCRNALRKQQQQQQQQLLHFQSHQLPVCGATASSWRLGR